MSKPPGGPPKLKKRQPPTREGWWFLGATLLVGAAAVDAGINLYFLTFGMMVCLVVAGIALSELGLAGLRVRRVLPPAVHAGTPYLMGIALENRKRRLPSFSIEVEDLIDGRPIEKRCYFLKLPAGRLQETAYRNTMPKRGRYRLSGFRLATKFPFGLVPRTRAVADADELFVYPALIPAPEALLRGLRRTSGPGDRSRPAARASFAACAPTATAMTRATSIGARARAAGYGWCGKKKTSRRARRRSSSTTARRRRPTRRRSSAPSPRRPASASSSPTVDSASASPCGAARSGPRSAAVKRSGSCAPWPSSRPTPVRCRRSARAPWCGFAPAPPPALETGGPGFPTLRASTTA